MSVHSGMPTCSHRPSATTSSKCHHLGAAAARKPNILFIPWGLKSATSLEFPGWGVGREKFTSQRGQACRLGFRERGTGTKQEAFLPCFIPLTPPPQWICRCCSGLYLRPLLTVRDFIYIPGMAEGVSKGHI